MSSFWFLRIFIPEKTSKNKRKISIGVFLSQKSTKYESQYEIRFVFVRGKKRRGNDRKK